MKRLLAFFLLMLCAPVFSAVYIIHDTEESSVRALSFQLSKRLPITAKITPVRRAVFSKSFDQTQSSDVLVTIGADSFRQVCFVAPKGGVIALFIGKEEYLQIQSWCSVSSSAVFSGAPLEKRLILLDAIGFDRKPLAVIYSDFLFINKAEMQAQAVKHGFEFNFLKTSTDRLSVLKSINYMLEDSSVIFALVDTELYKNGIAQDILRLMFHKQQVIIGSSLAFVKAGSLFAIYSDTEAKLNTLAKHITQWETQSQHLSASYPDTLRVSFNPYLIKYHGVVLPSAAFLKEKYGLCSAMC